MRGSGGTGTAIDIPAYTELATDENGDYIEAASGTRYKRAITFLNAYVPDAQSMYKSFLSYTTSDGWLLEQDDNGNPTGDTKDMHIQTYIVDCDSFNADPQRYMVDAEGNYRVDSVGWGVCCYEEPDLSGKAYWVLKDYLANGYGFLAGHDTMYAYAGAYYDAYGADLDESTIDPNDGTTWYYAINSWLPYGYTRDGRQSNTRGGHFYHNNRVYDQTSAGIINNIQPEARSGDSGIIPGDTVRFNTTAVYGSYVDKDGKAAIHNSDTNNGGSEYTMYRNAKLSDLFIVHSEDSDPHHNYRLGAETYTGAINKRPVVVHSLYLEEPDHPRNVKTYDSTNQATITDILIDNVLPGDEIGLKQQTMTGTYATAQAGETLTADGKTQKDRLKKLQENVITASTNAELTGNDFGDYFIEREIHPCHRRGNTGGILAHRPAAYNPHQRGTRVRGGRCEIHHAAQRKQYLVRHGVVRSRARPVSRP